MKTHYAVSDNMRNYHLKQETPQYTLYTQYTLYNKGAPLHYNSYHEKYYQKGLFLG